MTAAGDICVGMSTICQSFAQSQADSSQRIDTRAKTVMRPKTLPACREATSSNLAGITLSPIQPGIFHQVIQMYLTPELPQVRTLHGRVSFCDQIEEAIITVAHTQTAGCMYAACMPSRPESEDVINLCCDEMTMTLGKHDVYPLWTIVFCRTTPQAPGRE